MKLINKTEPLVFVSLYLTVKVNYPELFNFGF